MIDDCKSFVPTETQALLSEIQGLRNQLAHCQAERDAALARLTAQSAALAEQDAAVRAWFAPLLDEEAGRPDPPAP